MVPSSSSSSSSSSHKKRPLSSEINIDDDDSFIQNNLDNIEELETKMSIYNKFQFILNTDTKKKVSAHLLCHLCNDILCYPIFMNCCQKKYCKSCIAKFWKTTTKKCPTVGCSRLVKTKLDDLHIDRDTHEVCLSLFPDQVVPRLSDLYDKLTDYEKRICIMSMITANIESRSTVKPESAAIYINKLSNYLNAANLDNIVRCNCDLVMIPSISQKQGNWYIGCPLFLFDKNSSCQLFNNIQDINQFFKDEETLKQYNDNLIGKKQTIFPAFKKSKK